MINYIEAEFPPDKDPRSRKALELDKPVSQATNRKNTAMSRRKDAIKRAQGVDELQLAGCPCCGKIGETGAFCNHCGSPSQESEQVIMSELTDKCPRCSASHANETVCHSCGWIFTDDNIQVVPCQQCGKYAEDGVFCPHCGFHNAHANPLAQPLCEVLTALVDLNNGYPVDELHKPLPKIVDEAKAALKRAGIEEEEDAWTLDF